MSDRLRRFMPRRLRIGLAVGERTVRAVGVQGGAVWWALEAELDDGESMASAIQQLLGCAPLPRWPRPALTVSLGPGRSQVRQLPDLPPVKDRRALAALIQEGASRFFLRNGVPLVTSVAVAPPDGTAPWAAAFDRPMIDDVAAACRQAEVRFDAAIPSVAVLGRVLLCDRIRWVDGDTVAECRYDHGTLCELRRSRGGARPPEDCVPEQTAGGDDDLLAAPLAVLGEGAIRFTDAYGAAMSPKHAPLAYEPGREPGVARPLPKWRAALAALVFVASAAAALIAPAVRDARAIAHATTRLAALGAERAEAARLERELALVSTALDEVASFAREQQSPVAVLRAVADSLPEGQALVMLRLDTLGGTAVLLAPRIAAAVGALDRLPVMTGVEIVGPVTREAVAGRELERATVRFTLHVDSPRDEDA